MTNTDDQERIDDEAADWHARLHAGDADKALIARFETWLHADRAHKRAYHEYEQLYRDLDYAVIEADIDVDAYIDHRPFNLLAWFQERLPEPAVWGGAMASAVAVLLAIVLLPNYTAAPVTSLEPTHETQLAEIREIVLEDGSVVTLGARSQIATEFTANTRQVSLLAGEAFFEVAKDPDRPFYVAAEDTLVRVVGTKFDVKHGAGAIHVSVLEGVVEVMKPDNISETIETADTRQVDKQVLTAGDRVAAKRAAPLPRVESVETVKPGAWRTGRLAYEDASLAEIVADANRYHARSIIVASNDLESLRATIAFRTDDIDQMLELVEAIHPIEVVDRGVGNIELRKARTR